MNGSNQELCIIELKVPSTRGKHRWSHKQNQTYES